MSTEAAAGKNPVSHVGKIYNLLAHEMAGRIHSSVQGIEEVSVWLCSQIGRPLADPWSVAVELIPVAGARVVDLEPAIRDAVQVQFEGLPAFIDRLTRGELPVC
jgi:S-adenosylmethionine synthetase